jgi:hypothetical protein
VRPIPNDSAQEAAASLWVFRGPWVAALAGGCAVAFCGFRVLAAFGVDLPVNLLVSSIPILLAVAFVVFFVNGQAPSYPVDAFRWLLFSLRVWVHRLGWTDRPPELWLLRRAPTHFSAFSNREVNP